MRYATPLRPGTGTPRTPAELHRWRQTRDRWMASLQPSALFQRLFEHVPGVHFFAKDKAGHIMFASRDLLHRYQMRDDSDIIGLTDFDINPDSMAAAYVRDDQRILAGETPILERIELWWDHQGMPDWFLVTKLPLLDRRGRVQGVMGLLRRPDDAERQLPVFQTVARAVEAIRRDYAKPLIIAEVASACGQSLRQLQRRFRTAFGITPQEFLIKTRVLAASTLLEQSTLTAAEIARRCGFVDQSSFTLHFRRRTGSTPTAYRTRWRARTGVG